MALFPYHSGSMPRAAGYAAGARRLVFGVLLAVMVVGCQGKADYALQVDGTGYTARELGMLDPAQQSRLADLTAFGLSVAQGRISAVARPYIDADVQALLLQKLATEVALRESGEE